MLSEREASQGAVPRGAGDDDHPDDVGFEATLVLHLVYSNAESAKVAGHTLLNGYATAKCKHPAWFKSKDAFMGFVCEAFERLYDEMKDGSGSKSPDAV